jgi:hypothetical protein
MEDLGCGNLYIQVESGGIEMATYQEISKGKWTPGKSVTQDSIQLGALLRIADSMEIIAQDYRRLIQENEQLRNQIKHLAADLQTERRRVAAYRGRTKANRKRTA